MKPVALHKLPGPQLAAYANTWTTFLPIGSDIRILILALCDRFNPELKGKLPERIINGDSP